MKRPALVAALVAVGAVFFVACGEDEDPCPKGGEGGVLIEASGLPDTAAPAVTLTSDEGEISLEGLGEQGELPTGAYTVTARIVAAPEDRVRRAFRPFVETTQVCVRAGAFEPVRVGYEEILSGGKLWAVGSEGAGSILALSEEVLMESRTDVGFAVKVTASPGVNEVTDATFDADGNLWVVDRRSGASRVRRFPGHLLGQTGTVTADVELSGPALAGEPGAYGLAFDKAGNLWVSVRPSNTVVRFGADKLHQSGQPEADVVLGGPQSELGAPAGLAFDAEGNLWVAGFGSSRVARFRSNRLSTNNDAPDLVLEARTPQPVVTTLGSPVGLAFDGANNLWVAYSGANTLARLAPADRGDSGSRVVTPQIQLRLPAGELAGLAFDEGKGLWTVHGNNRLARMGPGQLLGSGEVAPDVVLQGDNLGQRRGLAFYPAQEDLPLFHQLP